MAGWVESSHDACLLHLFADADFAGCAKTPRSTSGAHVALLGPNTVWPIAGQSKKQTSVLHSTPEAEIVAADHAMCTFGVPSLDLWEHILGTDMQVQFHEDTATACIVLKSG